MVSTSSESTAQEIISSRVKKRPHKMRRLVVILGIVIALAAIGYFGYRMYQADVDKKAETARTNAEEKIESTTASTVLGGQFFVDYSVAVARGDESAARAAYSSDNDSIGAQSLNCTRLFFAATELNVQSDIDYAADCIERVGTTYEDAYRIAAMYKTKGDIDNARRFAAVAAKALNPESTSRQSNLETLKEFGYEE